MAGPSLVVLGLDGGSWTLLRSLIDAGKLPSVDRMCLHGATSILSSIIPPVTGPAWPVMATGLNPGRLGTFDFYNRRSLEDTNLYPVRSSAVRGRAFWDVLSARDYRVGVFNYPMLLPTYELNGWMVAGLGSAKAPGWVWPADLCRELEGMAHPYMSSLSYSQPKYVDNHALLLEDLRTMLSGRLTALESLLQQHPVDVLVAVIGAMDILSHTCWHLWDPQHPLHDGRLAGRLGPQVAALWSTLDAGIGRLAASLAPGGHLMLVSDHGFGPSYGVFHVNSWLEQQGYLVRSVGSAHLGNRLRGCLSSRLSTLLNPLFKKLQGTPAHFRLRASILREIDLAQTRAFALETTDVCGMVFINRLYAKLSGLDEAQFVRETRNQLCELLPRSAHALGLDIELYSPLDLYVGRFAALAPELLFKINDFAVSVSYKFAPEIYERRLHNPIKTGNHRQEGIFLGYGPKIQGGARPSPLSILDIAPTVYQLLGEPVPTGLDGRVATEVLCPEYRTSIASSGAEMGPVSLDCGEYDTVEEAEEMRQRLRGLGYLD